VVPPWPSHSRPSGQPRLPYRRHPTPPADHGRRLSSRGMASEPPRTLHHAMTGASPFVRKDGQQRPSLSNAGQVVVVLCDFAPCAALGVRRSVDALARVVGLLAELFGSSGHGYLGNTCRMLDVPLMARASHRGTSRAPREPPSGIPTFSLRDHLERTNGDQEATTKHVGALIRAEIRRRALRKFRRRWFRSKAR
jgi:hypothetical protein